MQTVSTCLWFDDRAEEAVAFYISLFWLTDRFGMSWQIVPRRLLELLNTPDNAASQRVFAALMKMRKLDIAALERAYAGL